MEKGNTAPPHEGLKTDLQADYSRDGSAGARPQSIDEPRNLVETVRQLCEEGNLEAAYDLYRSRLTGNRSGNPDFDVFRDTPALAEGIKCTQAFIGGDDRQELLKERLGKPVLGAFLNKMGLYEHLSGNLSEAKEWYSKSLEFERGQDNVDGEIVAFHELSMIECTLGNIEEASSMIAHAISLPHSDRFNAWMNEYSYKAFCELLLGDVDAALLNFGRSLFFQKRHEGSHMESTYGLAGIQCAEFFLRTKSLEAFKKVNAFNIDVCEKNGWTLYQGICQIIQCWFEISCNLMEDAEKSLTKADNILRPAGVLEQICRLDILWAKLYGVRNRHDDALQKLNETIAVSVDRGFKLLQADALVMRANINLMRYKIDIVPNEALLEKVGDDGYAALNLADQCRYIWARFEAQQLLSLYHKIKSQAQLNPSREDEKKTRNFRDEASEIRRKVIVSAEAFKKLRSLGEECNS